jgi:hypothetical protein
MHRVSGPLGVMTVAIVVAGVFVANGADAP